MNRTEPQRRWALLLLAVLVPACERAQAPVAQEPAATPLRAVELKIHGHRGARGLAPENTLPSFEAALDLEVDVLEIDLQFTRDRKLAVWHDPYITATLCRVKGPLVFDPVAFAQTDPALVPPQPLDGPVVDPDVMPPLHPAMAVANQRADQLRKLRCDRNPNVAEFPDQKRSDDGDYGIVELGELLDFVKTYATNPAKTESQRANARRMEFNIETKRDKAYPTFIADRFDGVKPGLFEMTLHEMLERHGVSARTIVQSFDHRSLWAMKTLNPTVRLSALHREGDEADFTALALAGAHIWSPKYLVLTPELVKTVRGEGLMVIPYTVNDPEHAKTLIGFGVDGLITDRPDLVRRSR